MAESTRRLFVGGNWKSNNTLSESKALVDTVINKLTYDENNVDVIVSPIALQIPAVLAAITNKVQVAAQNSSATGLGAFTGEIAPQHVKDIGLNWVILGHSERRTRYGETDDLVAKKTRNALDSNLKVIFCIGETLEQREANQTTQVTTTQLDAARAVLKTEDWNNIVVAYEPVWAIGTGKTASPEQAEEVHSHIRSWLGQVSAETSHSVRVIYGGSVTDANAAELIQKPNIDGFLVGGASLKPAFTKIVEACNIKK